MPNLPSKTLTQGLERSICSCRSSIILITFQSVRAAAAVAAGGRRETPPVEPARLKEGSLHEGAVNSAEPISAVPTVTPVKAGSNVRRE